MEYFRSCDVEHEPLLIDHEILVGKNTVVALNRQYEHDVSVEQQFKPDVFVEQQSEPDERITAIETFLMYKNESVSEDSMAKHKEFIHKENESANGKVPENSLSDVLNGEFSCDINRPNEHMSEEFVENELETSDGK
nr:hypothetical protein [Tanacetum cinerariifolium]